MNFVISVLETIEIVHAQLIAPNVLNVRQLAREAIIIQLHAHVNLFIVIAVYRDMHKVINAKNYENK